MNQGKPSQPVSAVEELKTLNENVKELRLLISEVREEQKRPQDRVEQWTLDVWGQSFSKMGYKYFTVYSPYAAVLTVSFAGIVWVENLAAGPNYLDLPDGAQVSCDLVTVVRAVWSNYPMVQSENEIKILSGSVEVSNDAGNPLPVSGTVEVSNDAGNPLPVSGTVEVSNDAGNALPVDEAGGTWVKVTAAGTGDQVVKAAPGKVYALVQDGAATIYLKDGAAQAWKAGDYTLNTPIVCLTSIVVNFSAASSAWVLYK